MVKPKKQVEVIGEAPPKFEWPRITIEDKEVKNKDTGQTQIVVTGRKVHRNSLANIAYHLKWSDAEPRYNAFADRVEVRGKPIDEHTVNVLWFDARSKGLPDELDAYIRAVNTLGHQKSYHPVIEYLEWCESQWDGKKRVDTWLQTYCGAADSEVMCEFSRVSLLGPCWRVMQPGCKFDTALILYSPDQGKDKSKTIAVLGGQWYSDNFDLTLKSKELVEQTQGKWVIEVPEMTGMWPSKVNQIKAQLSRQVETVRMAWGKMSQDYPRQFALYGTTNDTQFLKDPTGNRRFLPVEVGKVDLKALSKARDQLWGEAYHRALSKEEPVIAEKLWAAAGELQEAHRAKSPFEELIEELMYGSDAGRIDKKEIWRLLEQMSDGRFNRADQRQSNLMTAVMARLGWRTDKQRCSGSKPTPCYVKGDSPRWLSYEGRFKPSGDPEHPEQGGA